MLSPAKLKLLKIQRSARCIIEETESDVERSGVNDMIDRVSDASRLSDLSFSDLETKISVLRKECMDPQKDYNLESLISGIFKASKKCEVKKQKIDLITDDITQS